MDCNGRTNVLIDTKWLICYNVDMYKLINKAGTELENFSTLDSAIKAAKVLGCFVTIKGPDFEVCGIFGVDSIRGGRCPDGVAYDWNKASRIGRVKKERV